MSEEKLLPYLLILPLLHITSPNPAEIGTGTVTTPPVSSRLVHYTRITGAFSISFMGDPNITGDPNAYDDVQRIKRACEIVRQATVLRKDPNHPGGGASVPDATLTIVYTPYHWIVGKVRYPNTYPGEPNGPQTECTCNSDPNDVPCFVDDPRQTCNDTAEIDLYAARCQFIKTHVAAFNSAYSGQPGTPVAVGQQFFDDERWSTSTIPSWNAAVTAKHNRFYDEGKVQWPAAAIHWYDRGSVYLIDHQGTGAYNPWQGVWFALDEKGEAYSVSLYGVWDLDRSRESMRRTAQKASDWKRDHSGAYGTGQLTPWIGLACGQPEIGSGEMFELDMDYGFSAARDMGALLRALRAADPNNPLGVDPNRPVAINHVGLYPEPFSAATPRYTQYFVEYVRGFTD